MDNAALANLIFGRRFIARQGDHKAQPTMVEVRAMTRAEILALQYGQQVALVLTNGRLGHAKVNGAVRRWKRDPERVEIPLKYGLYEYATYTMPQALDRFVVECPCAR